MQKKTYKPRNETPMTVGEPVVAYQRTTSKTSSSNSWDPNVPFHGTQEEWWGHFHQIEQGYFTPLEEHERRFEAWKKEFLASRLK